MQEAARGSVMTIIAECLTSLTVIPVTATTVSVLDYVGRCF
jgi:hypothetical protein